MNITSPAIVAQNAVRRLPRPALIGLCLAYVMAGFWGRAPWKNADVTAFGYMMELAQGHSHWLNPLLAGMPPETDGLLAYWIGAWSIMLAPSGWPPEIVSRLPFVLMLCLTLVATWYAVYYLAKSPKAQPVAFAFGGEARPTDYARALADGGLLALMACLGLARLSHEVTSYLTQLCCIALTFYAVSSSPYRRSAPLLAFALGLAGLALSGAPVLGPLLGGGCAALMTLQGLGLGAEERRHHLRAATAMALLTAAAVALVWALDLARWRVVLPDATETRSLVRLLIWFAWPAWPLALLSLWRWRHQLGSWRWPLHLALPLWFVLLSVTATFTTLPADRALLLGLPALASLAAFALPTLSRSLSALIDWFTLLFFTGAALIIWVIWLAMQTGFPEQPAANVMRLAPGFQPDFSWFTLLCALAATAVWAGLVRWRIGRHPAAIWKSLVLPASGAALGWILLMTLWLPLLDYALSYAPMVQAARTVMGTPDCVEEYGLSRAQVAAFQFHGELRVQAAHSRPSCPWILVSREQLNAWRRHADTRGWKFESTVWRPVEQREAVLLFRQGLDGE